ncbi:MAG TPA: tetratricopeptide repeat protein [Azospirillaceae bacterium]|nr:tetratricopeptide repeat protein [Azospirillaceae bacterium]
MPESPHAGIARLIQEGRLPEADALCRAALEENPNDGHAWHLAGLVAYRSGRPVEALECFDRAVVAAPGEPAFHNNRGALLYAGERWDQAADAFRAALELAPGQPATLVNLGNALQAAGRLEEAERAFRGALDLVPEHAGALAALGRVALASGRPLEALELCRRAAALQPDSADAQYALGEASYAADSLEEAERRFRRATELAPSLVPAWVGLAQVQHADSRTGDALATVEAAVAAGHGGRPEIDFIRRFLHSSMVPAWHLPMLNDTVRNEAYREALEGAVTEGCHVLEIGTGSGLVAMMAARLGAARVTTCEINPLLARVAAETVARNGLSDRVHVVAKKSTRLAVGQDMPRPADVFVSELINVGMLAPEMLAVLRHARRELVRPGGAIIPRAATVHGLLIEAPELARVNPLRDLCGFDLSAFDVFRTPGTGQIDLDRDPHRALSAPFAALPFDFTRDMPDAGRVPLEVEAAAEGTLHAVAFWFDLHLDERVTYSSRGAGRTNHWKQAVLFLDRPRAVRAGERLALDACWDNTRIFFELR